ncbi:hypothetical protein WMF26_32095 [Sorangium sp. So ce185]|uniref:hypothetical protein n=1 Tax=Sorangium sp. So ce185 TaxID=3133287 RepID=UPI003F607EAE
MRQNERDTPAMPSCGGVCGAGLLDAAAAVAQAAALPINDRPGSSLSARGPGHARASGSSLACGRGARYPLC